MYYRGLIGSQIDDLDRADDAADETRSPRVDAPAAAKSPFSESAAFSGAALLALRTGDPVGDASKGEPMTCYSWDDRSETVMKFDGKVWTVTQKDIASGRIERFTQASGDTDHGRLDVFQGHATAAPEGALERKLFSWEGVEDRGRVIGSHENQQLPRTMRRDVAGTILTAPAQVGEAMNNLLPDKVRHEMAEETRALVNQLNHPPGSQPSPH